jgi:hypothetical protein
MAFTFLSLYGRKTAPHQMAQAYFSLVEELLKDLCKEEKWGLEAGATFRNSALHIIGGAAT